MTTRTARCLICGRRLQHGDHVAPVEIGSTSTRTVEHGLAHLDCAQVLRDDVKRRGGDVDGDPWVSFDSALTEHLVDPSKN